jgi:serine protease inhibitor
MARNRSRLALVVAALAVTAACGSKEDPTGPPAAITALPRDLTTAERAIASAGNSFSFALFGRLATDQPETNIFVSPLSASMALGMTMTGAANETYDAMRGTLGFAGNSDAEIKTGYQGLIGLLRGLDATTDFRIANSIWTLQGFPVEPAFLADAKTYFDAEVAELDFAAPSSLTRINDWVSRSTNGKIPTIFDEIPDDNVMFLINAIYFKGDWRSAFPVARTQDAPFHGRDGIARTVKLMNQSTDLSYLRRPEFQAVDLAYGNTAFTMTVILPEAGVDINTFAASIDQAKWDEWVGGFAVKRVNLSVPKVRLEYERVMNDDLTALGMGIAFHPSQADFTRLSPDGRDLFISVVKQKTFVDIYEEGTEAAAATVVGVAPTSAPLEEVVRVDRPFIIVIRERFSGTILFMGRIVRLGT